MLALPDRATAYAKKKIQEKRKQLQLPSAPKLLELPGFTDA
jgi:hypothetical protein